MDNEHSCVFRVIFAKKGDMKFISHLDLARLFARAARRAGFALVLSKGFNPRPKISFKRALKLGFESESEEVEFRLGDFTSEKDLRDRLQAQLPEGIAIKNTEVIF